MATTRKPSTRTATKAPAKPRGTRKPAAAKAATATPKPDKLEGSQPTARKPRAPVAARKPATAKAAPKRAPAKAAPKRRRTGLIASIAVGIIAAGSALALFGRRLLEPGNAEHEAPDLDLDLPRYGADVQRAPDAFRPDPTAEVPANERDGLRPATQPLTTH